MRGQAYLAPQQPAQAAAEFQRILDHRGITLVDPMDAFARLQLGRALVASGDMEKTNSIYSELLQLWKDADGQMPVPTQPRAEYDRLP